MSRLRMVWVLVGCVGCTDRGTRSGAMPERADFLPMVSDSGQLQEEQDSEQPRLVLRCKQGRMDAYLVVGTALAVDSGLVDDEAVPVKLDSAPPC